MLILGFIYIIGNPKVILRSSLFVLSPPAFEPLSSSTMFPKRDEDGCLAELAVCFHVVTWPASGSNCNTPTSLAFSRNSRISSGTSDWSCAVVRVSSRPLFTVIYNCGSIKLGRSIPSL